VTTAAYTHMVASLSFDAAAAYNSSTSVLDWQITNLHGDVVASIRGSDAGLTSTRVYDEHGAPRNSADVGTVRYGWLGAEQRSADNPAGLIAMGVRVYNPAAGRFLSVDPIYGGNANPYEYCSGDSVNCSDITGQFSCKYFTTTKLKRFGIPYLWHNWYHCKMSRGEVLAWLGAGGTPLILKDWTRRAALKVVRGFVIAAMASVILGWMYAHKCTRNKGIGFDAYSGYDFRLPWVYDAGVTRVWCR
jgi:RHS repeat-associated protein